VAGLVKQTPGTLGYNEVAYALQNGLTYATIKNAAGKFVKPTLENISAAAASAKPDDNLKIVLVNQPGDNTYPISTTTYFLLNKDYSDAAKGQAIVSFVWYALHQGGTDAKTANYAPLPDSLLRLAEAKLKTITAGGQPIIK
jgi:phosphate transport system substrate-binding protein